MSKKTKREIDQLHLEVCELHAALDFNRDRVISYAESGLFDFAEASSRICSEILKLIDSDLMLIQKLEKE